MVPAAAACSSGVPVARSLMASVAATSAAAWAADSAVQPIFTSLKELLAGPAPGPTTTAGGPAAASPGAARAACTTCAPKTATGTGNKTTGTENGREIEIDVLFDGHVVTSLEGRPL